MKNDRIPNLCQVSWIGKSEEQDVVCQLQGQIQEGTRWHSGGAASNWSQRDEHRHCQGPCFLIELGFWWPLNVLILLHPCMYNCHLEILVESFVLSIDWLFLSFIFHSIFQSSFALYGRDDVTNFFFIKITILILTRWLYIKFDLTF